MTKTQEILVPEQTCSKPFEGRVICGKYFAPDEIGEIPRSIVAVPATLLAIYSHKKDCTRVYVCGPEHLREIAQYIKEGDHSQLVDLAGQDPRVIVNGQGEIERDISLWILKELGASQKRYSSAKHLEEFWEREKHHFGFVD